METVMHARFVMIAAVALAAGTAASAEPTKAPAQPAAQPANGPAPAMLLASRGAPHDLPLRRSDRRAAGAVSLVAPDRVGAPRNRLLRGNILFRADHRN